MLIEIIKLLLTKCLFVPFFVFCNIIVIFQRERSFIREKIIFGFHAYVFTRFTEFC
jgi:hypothetical protein